MLLTLTTTHRPATDLGFLVMKHPDNVHEAELPFGRATIFFPEASEERCTAAVDHAPLTRVHQCVFAILAMESEPVDPRL